MYLSPLVEREGHVTYLRPLVEREASPDSADTWCRRCRTRFLSAASAAPVSVVVQQVEHSARPVTRQQLQPFNNSEIKILTMYRTSVHLSLPNRRSLWRHRVVPLCGVAFLMVEKCHGVFLTGNTPNFGLSSQFHNFMKCLVYGTTLGPVDTKCQRQHCDDASDYVLIENNEVSPEWVCIPCQWEQNR